MSIQLNPATRHWLYRRRLAACLFLFSLFYPGYPGWTQTPSRSEIEISETEVTPPLTTSPSLNLPDSVETPDHGSPEEGNRLPAESLPVQSEEKSVEPLQTIRTIHIAGSTLLTADQTAEVTNPFLGQEVSLDLLKNLSEAITRAYHRQGFFLTKAYLPEQEIQQGKVVIAVLEGKIGKLLVTGNEYYPTSFIEKHFMDIREPRGARLDLIERTILILNDYPDLKANVFIKEGKDSGEADMEVQIQDYQPVHLTLDYNNFGSSYISRDRFGIEAEIGNLFSDGHRFVLRGMMGSPRRDMSFIQGRYSAPFGNTGEKFDFSYMRGDFDVGREFAQLDIRMKTESTNLSVSYPFLKTDHAVLTGEMGFEGNNFTQTTLGLLSSQDRIRLLKGGLDYNRVRENTRDFVSFRVSQGLGSLFEGMSGGSPFVSRANADNQFTKATVEAVRMRTVPEPYWLFHPFSIILRGGGQISSDNLVVGEQFVLGGPDSVRGYGNGEFLGDHGYRMSGELRVSPLKSGKYLQAAVFLDHGGSFIKGRKSEDHYLTGIGWGLRFDFPKTVVLREPRPEMPGYSMDYRFQIRADVAYPIEPRPSLSGKNPVYLIYAVGRF